MNARLKMSNAGEQPLPDMQPWADLGNSFDLLATAPDGVASLRGLILKLAVTGRLVPQRTDDEPAEVQLRRILVRKAARLSVSRTNHERSIDSNDESLVISDLPLGWSLARLNELVTVINGRAYRKQELLASGTPVLRVGNLFTSKDWYYSDLALEPEKYCDKGDLIFSWSASFGPFIWKGPKVIYHYHIWKLDLHSTDDLSKDYLHTFLMEKTQELKAAGHGVSMIHMTKESMERVVVPLPPLAEQHRIVARLKELMALCDSLEKKGRLEDEQHARLVSVLFDSLVASESPQALAENWQRIAQHFDLLLDRPEAVDLIEQTTLELAVRGLLAPEHRNDEPAERLLKRLALCNEIKDSTAYLPKLIEDREKPFKLPPSWDWVRLGDIVSIKHGFAFSSESFTSEPTPFVLTTPGHFHEKGGFRDRGPRTKYYDGSVDPSFILKPGDLIIPMTEQAPGLLGSPAFVPDDGKTYLHNQRLGKLVFSSDLIAPEFIFWFFNCAFFRSELAGTCTGMKVRHTSPKKILNVPVPVCSLAEQHRIVDRIKQLRELCAQLRECLALESSTQARLAHAVVASIA
jgi:type I restriction enzyme S subunit